MKGIVVTIEIQSGVSGATFKTVLVDGAAKCRAVKVIARTVDDGADAARSCTGCAFFERSMGDRASSCSRRAYDYRNNGNHIECKKFLHRIYPCYFYALQTSNPRRVLYFAALIVSSKGSEPVPIVLYCNVRETKAIIVPESGNGRIRLNTNGFRLVCVELLAFV